MHTRSSRRRFLAQSTLIPACLFAGGNLTSSALAALNPVRRVGGPHIKVALNAYSFSKVLNSKSRDSGFGLLELVDYCAQQGFEGLDATGYFFPDYPKVPPDRFVYELKRRAFDCGVGISGTGVRNNFTTADREVRAAGVQHVKEWVEVAAKLGAPVVRVFADTQMRSQTWQTVAPGASRDEVENWIADDLRQCAEHGERFGVIIGVQNHGDFLKTSDEHLSLVRRVDSPWCGPIVDTGYYKTDDPYQDIAAVRAVRGELANQRKPHRRGKPRPHRSESVDDDRSTCRLPWLSSDRNALVFGKHVRSVRSRAAIPSRSTRGNGYNGIGFAAADKCPRPAGRN